MKFSKAFKETSIVVSTFLLKDFIKRFQPDLLGNLLRFKKGKLNKVIDFCCGDKFALFYL